MDNVLLDQMVLHDGTLDSSKLASRETLYVGRNGKAVERFVVDPDDNRSFIFKPLTNLETIGRESWVYQNLLPHIPARYPNLLAQAKHRDAERYWAIYEDLGKLEHRFDRDTLIKAAAAIPSWHQLPLECVPEDFTGHTPNTDNILNEVKAKMGVLKSTLERLAFPAYLIERAQRIVLELDDGLLSEMTVSHGDYHPLNLSLRNDQITILDWEYVHLNSVYWDLYNLLDITSPNYRRPEVTASLRNEVLQVYYARRLQLGWSSRFCTFQKNYYRYALIHSLWIMTLIEKDLQAGVVDRSGLLEQQQETKAIIMDILLEENEIRV
ncbi:phosphotransferase [Paenibacillus sp. RC67]|uniref:phosphotransferase n=1 Tax=Paenibacillus sp. RC67 TaxID=3039392 RepID=UPI0024AE6D95|nr:phosphotransferase [Paenibacillus sp. RC67]